MSKFRKVFLVPVLMTTLGAIPVLAQDRPDEHRDQNRSNGDRRDQNDRDRGNQDHENQGRGNQGRGNRDHGNQDRDRGDMHGNGHDNRRYVHHQDWQRGHRMREEDWNRGERVDWRQHRLRRPSPGYEWRQVDGNYVMAAVATGVIVSILIANSR